MDNTEELLKSLEESIKKDAKRREPYVKALIKKLDIPKEKASSLVFDANEISYTTNEFALVVEYYCDVFNGIDNLDISDYLAPTQQPKEFTVQDYKDMIFAIRILCRSAKAN